MSFFRQIQKHKHLSFSKNLNNIFVKNIETVKQVPEMQCLRNIWMTINKLVVVSDRFAPPILLRYQSEDKMPTKTGGCFSIILIIVIVSFFASQWFNVLDKKEINSESYIVRDLDPSPKQITRDDFMFTISMVGVDIFNQKNRYFDIIVTEEIRINSTSSFSEPIDMIPCQRDTFQKYGEEISAIFDNLHLSNALCFPENFRMNVTGKWASEEFRYLRVHIKRCHGDGCLDDIQFQNYLNANGAFYINYYFINKLINPTKLEPISIYFQDKNYNMVNDRIAIDTNLYLAEYNLETDESLWPWEELNVSSGVYVDRTQKEEFIHPAQNGSYAQFHIRKSDQKMIIKRSFRRIDDLLSYLGGLFGILASVCGILLSHYNQCCFELEICGKVFALDSNSQDKDDDGEGEQTASNFFNRQDKYQEKKQENFQFNFLRYLQYLIYYPIHMIKPDFKWKKAAMIFDKIEQSRNQMNIDILLQKISFYDRAFQCLFDDDQMMLLYLQQKISLKQLKQQRVLMSLNMKSSEAAPSNEIANDFIIEEKQPKSKTDKVRMSDRSLAVVFEGLRADPEYQNIQSTLAIKNIGQQMIIKNFNGDMEITDQISEALQNISKRSQMGDQVCQRILAGIHHTLIKNYQKRQNSYLVQSKPNQRRNNPQRKSPKKISAFLNLSQYIGKQNNSQPQKQNPYELAIANQSCVKVPKIKIFDVESYKNIGK